MPELTTTEWTCSRCAATKTLPDRDQPETWCRLISLCPPRASIDADGVQFLGDLCKECVDALGYFLRNMTTAVQR